MSTYVLSASAIGPTTPYAVQLKKAFWSGVGGVSLLVNFTGATSATTGAASGAAAVATATVQVSNDPLALTNPNAARWNAHDVLFNLTTDQNSSLAYTVSAIRLNLTSYTSGTVVLQIGVSDQI